MEGAAKVMHQQLELVEEKGHYPTKVILAGGFGRSPALRERLKSEPRKRYRVTSYRGYKTDLVDTSDGRNAENAVSCGAVLGAFD